MKTIVKRQDHQSEKKKTKKSLILYIDDDKQNLISFKYQFQDFYKIFLAESAKEGYKILKENDIQVIIADQRMPKMTGTDFFEKILPEYPDTIRMIITGFSDIGAVIDGINKGKIYYYLQKPWNEEEIKIVINNAIEATELTRKNRQLINNLKITNQSLINRTKELEQEIKERIKTEIKIEASLKEKELLLREVHNRVKSNMQIISNTIETQTKHIKDDNVKRLIYECHNQIKTISLIHEKLYKTEDLAKINFSDYVNHLVSELFRIYNINTKQISIEIYIKNVYLNIQYAISCGLIINELVTNSIKHAFPGEKKGKIGINISIGKDKTYRLNIFDDGIGLPDNINLKTAKSIGLSLINIVTKEQLKGKIEIDRTTGTSYTISFK